MSSGFIREACVRISSLFKADDPLCVHRPLVVARSSVDGHVGHFRPLTVADAAAVSAGVFSSFGVIPRSEFAASYDDSLFTLLRNQSTQLQCASVWCPAQCPSHACTYIRSIPREKPLNFPTAAAPLLTPFSSAQRLQRLRVLVGTCSLSLSVTAVLVGVHGFSAQPGRAPVRWPRARPCPAGSPVAELAVSLCVLGSDPESDLDRSSGGLSLLFVASFDVTSYTFFFFFFSILLYFYSVSKIIDCLLLYLNCC